MEFDSSTAKEKVNIRKHGVTFAEAEEAFDDKYAIDEFDDAHSSNEEHRFSLIGLSSKRLLFVIYTVRQNEVIRLISARKATKSEEKLYSHEKE